MSAQARREKLPQRFAPWLPCRAPPQPRLYNSLCASATGTTPTTRPRAAAAPLIGPGRTREALAPNKPHGQGVTCSQKASYGQTVEAQNKLRADTDCRRVGAPRNRAGMGSMIIAGLVEPAIPSVQQNTQTCPNSLVCGLINTHGKAGNAPRTAAPASRGCVCYAASCHPCM